MFFGNRFSTEWKRDKKNGNNFSTERQKNKTSAERQEIFMDIKGKKVTHIQQN
jgi:hypothetical protein